MSRKIGSVFFSYEELPQVCEYCGQYGKDGKEICYECAQKPENKNEVEQNLENILLGKKEMPLRNDLAKDVKK